MDSRSAEKDADYWESLSKSELRLAHLSIISKSLPSRTSSRRTLAIYLRWLELHRVANTRNTLHWDNTILHWTQALRARGFTEEEINRAVRKWKDAHDWQMMSGRNPPGEKDIARAFGGSEGLTTKEMEDKMRRGREHEDARERERERRGKEEEHERERRREKGRKRGMDADLHDGGRNSYEHAKQRSSEYKRKESGYYDPEDRYHGIPYAGYICNRCGKEGHYVQVCPTNLDPSWDKPPEVDYECPLCGATGNHFKSLCPANEDPNCLNQKRRRAGIVTPIKKTQNFLADWERDLGNRSRERINNNSTRTEHRKRDHSQSPRDITTLTSKREELFAIDEKKKRLLAEDHADFTTMSSIKSEPDSSERYQKQNRTSNQHNVFGRLSPERNYGSPAPPRKRVRFAEPSSAQQGHTRLSNSEEGARSPPTANHDKELEVPVEMQSDSRKHTSKVDSSLLFGFQMKDFEPDLTMADYSYSSSSDHGRSPTPPEKKYSSLVLSLMKKHPKMTEVVNVLRRPTATDMWKQVTPHRLEKYQLTTPEQTRDSCAMSNPQSSSLVEAPDEDDFMGFDGVCDERSPHSRAHKSISSGSYGIKSRYSMDFRADSITSSKHSSMKDSNGIYYEDRKKLRLSYPENIAEEEDIRPPPTRTQPRTRELASNSRNPLFLPKMFAGSEISDPRKNKSTETNTGEESQLDRELRVAREHAELADTERRSARDKKKIWEDSELRDLEREARKGSSGVGDSENGKEINGSSQIVEKRNGRVREL